MTLGTCRNNTVFLSMTEITRNFCVATWVGDQLSILLGMAGQAFGLQLTFKNDIEWLVRVVAAQAIVKSVVFLAFMTLGAGRDIPVTDWSVAGMTINTVDLIFM